jgi:hypothetical protein
MANLVTVGEAVKHSEYSHHHILYLAREGKINARKSGSLWLVDLDSLIAYEREMRELGSKKHDPTRGNFEV